MPLGRDILEKSKKSSTFFIDLMLLVNVEEVPVYYNVRVMLVFWCNFLDKERKCRSYDLSADLTGTYLELIKIKIVGERRELCRHEIRHPGYLCVCCS